MGPAGRHEIARANSKANRPTAVRKIAAGRQVAVGGSHEGGGHQAVGRANMGTAGKASRNDQTDNAKKPATRM